MPIPLSIQVGGIPNTSLGDGVPVTMLGGKAAEGIVAELHGKWYTANYRGNVFFATTGSAGSIIPINAAAGSVVATFALWNPNGSGKNIELIDCDIQTVAASTVVGEIALWFQTGVGSSTAVPTASTGGTIRTSNIGAGINSVASYYTSLTIVGTATKGPTVSGWSATTSNSNIPGHTEFDGKVIVAPGTFVFLAMSTAASSTCIQTIRWAEWPV